MISRRARQEKIFTGRLRAGEQPDAAGNFSEMPTDDYNRKRKIGRA